VKEAANAYKRLGRVYFLASETVDTKAEYVESLRRVIETYNKSKDLFKQNKNKAEELECEAEALFAHGFIASSISDAKKSFSKSSDLFVEASNLFSPKSDDQESVARCLSRAAFCFIFLQPFSADKLEVDQNFQNGISLASKALKLSLNLGNLRIFSESIFSELMINMTKVFLKDFKKEPLFKEYLKDNIVKFDDYIKLLGNCDDNRSRAIIYLLGGFLYCLYATHYIKDEKEFNEYTDKGLKLLEETLVFARKANNKLFTLFT